MKTVLTKFFLIVCLLIGITSCSNHDGPIPDYCGTYETVWSNSPSVEANYVDRLMVEGGNIFSHYQGIYQKKYIDGIYWQGTYQYNPTDQTFVFQYLVEQYYQNGKIVETEYLIDDFCWGKLEGNTLFYKEYEDDDYSQYNYFIKIK